MKKLIALMGLALIITSFTVFMKRSESEGELVRLRAIRRSIDPATSCGPTTLAVICEYLGRPAKLADLHQECGAGDLGVCSIADLARVLRDHSFHASPVRLNPDEPRMRSAAMILHIDEDHFVAALPARSNDLVIIDPPLAPKLTSWADLRGRWRGNAVLVSAAKSVETERPTETMNK